MNSSIGHASATTHLKIVAIALLASVAVVWIGIFAQLTIPRGATWTPAGAGHPVVATATAANL